MTEPKLEYRMWPRGGSWHWQVMQVTADYTLFIASGVAGSSGNARIAALTCCHDRQSDHPKLN